jgi:hypothetical protein
MLSRIETLLSYAVYIVPSQMPHSQSAEVASEVLYAALALVRREREQDRHAQFMASSDGGESSTASSSSPSSSSSSSSSSPPSASSSASSSSSSSSAAAPAPCKTATRGDAHPLGLGAAAAWLERLQCTEVAAESIAERCLTTRGRWTVVTLIEATKALIRLRALWSLGGRIMLPSDLNPRLASELAGRQGSVWLGFCFCFFLFVLVFFWSEFAHQNIF